ncbi:hypothetical protein OPV22_025214 [Ensete ventricosum]|uniref:VQ domain-containing protein n=1 Tax=Ensete ventricosum TaxID=4639 RepID=A0AAV8Q6T1_ENSVE|nr:hypothetical protein OPV22_025214 [Ensete ventricosum]RWW24077.1 hypothetical protein GW17_00011655 [Ensete ventricosum]RZR78616.1 hypothetical protein BHM03_00004033 [Ensete ventricosum]
MDHSSSQSLQAAPPAPASQGRAPPYRAALHAVQKPQGKPRRRPDQPPPPPRVYRVEPRDFRQLVQRLTGAPRSVPAPCPLNVVALPPFTQQRMVGGGPEAAVSINQSPAGFLGVLPPPPLYSSLRPFPLLGPADPMGSMEQIWR